MNATLGNYPAAEMKASDADRDAVLCRVTYYAAAHPRWKHGTAAARQGNPTPAARQGNPTPADGQLRTAEPRPAAQARAGADHDAGKARRARGLNRVAWL
jgi:hypothetical protein